jgi:hypothetical protein
VQFINRLRIAWRYATAFYVGTPLSADYWTMEDAKALSNFLTGDTGTKVRWMLRNKVVGSAERAVMEMSDKSRDLAAYAAGVRGTVAELDQLLDMSRTREAIALSEDDIKALAERELL